jgi:DNA-directed RNA polymerase specialized sigma24 family protein
MAVRPRGVDLDGLYRLHATPLLRLALVLTGDPPLAEDLVQEAFVRLHRSGATPAAGTELAYLRRTGGEPVAWAPPSPAGRSSPFPRARR